MKQLVLLALLMRSCLGLILISILTACYPTSGTVPYVIEARKAQQPIRTDRRTPYMRIGGLPFARPFVPVTIVEPQELGQHVYLDGMWYPGRSEEVSRGAFYTLNGGFLDVAHTRNAIDLTRYCYERLLVIVQQAVEQQDGAVEQVLVLAGSEPSVYWVWVRDLDFAQSLSRSEQAEFEHHFTLRLSQTMAYVMCTWHEIITYFDYRGAGVIPENQSAFTWDDQASHMLGIHVAGQAINEMYTESTLGFKTIDWGIFDARVTRALSEQINGLNPVAAENTQDLINVLDHVWYEKGVPIKRLVHVGVDEEPLNPWLVEPKILEHDALTPSLRQMLDQAEPVSWTLPSMAHVMNFDTRGCFKVAIQPYILESKRIVQAIDPKREITLIDVDPDFSDLKQAILKQMRLNP